MVKGISEQSDLSALYWTESSGSTVAAVSRTSRDR